MKRINTKIVSIDTHGMARLFGWVYGALGCANAFLVLVVLSPSNITFPLGILIPFFNLTFSFNTPRPTHALDGVLAALGVVICFTVSGWITGATLAMGFNFASIYTGGLETRIFRFEADTTPEAEPVPLSLP